MATTDFRDRLQPALLDRLTDDHPQDRTEAALDRTMSKTQLRQAVQRDLGWLFNAAQPGRQVLDAWPLLADSVLNFGLPPLAGQLASKVDVSLLERAIHQTIVRFEPRILADTLTVHAIESTSVLDTHNLIEFEIRGHLWSQPVPIEILLRTQLDLEAGQVEVRDASAIPVARPR